MSNTVSEGISIRKKESLDSKLNRVPISKTFMFYDEPGEGKKIINLLSLTVPTGLAVSNPSEIDLKTMRLSLVKNNFKLLSSMEGELIQGDSFRILDSYTIELIGGAANGALDGEYFVGTVTNAPIDNIVTTDARDITRTYDLTDGQIEVVLGEDYEYGKNLTEQVGNIKVFKDGVQLYRCVDNDISKDGNYIEVSDGDGKSSTIKLKVAAVDGESLIVEFGKQYSGDITLWGQVEKVTAAVTKLAQDASEGFYGDDDTDRYLGLNPSEVDRRSFGDRVLNNKALLDAIGELKIPEYPSETITYTGYIGKISGGNINFRTLQIDTSKDLIEKVVDATSFRYVAKKRVSYIATFSGVYAASGNKGAGAIIRHINVSGVEIFRSQNGVYDGSYNSSSTSLTGVLEEGEWLLASTVHAIDIDDSVGTHFSVTATAQYKKIKELV